MLLQQLNTFTAVVEEGGFTRAAERLNLSQPAVTKQVKALEEEMGAHLLRREGRKVRLTAAGESVYTYAKRILHSLDECRTALDGLGAPGRGRLLIGAVSTVASFTLPGLLAAFARTHPQVTVQVRSGTIHEVLTMVVRNELDVGLLTVPMIHEHLETLHLFRDRVVIVASPSSPWAGRGVLQGREIRRIPMVAYRKDSRFRRFVDAAFEAAGIIPNILMEFDTHEAVKTMVKLGFGISVAPCSTVREELASGELVELTIDGFEELSRTTSLIIRLDRHRTPALQAFLALVRRTYPDPRGARPAPDPEVTDPAGAPAPPAAPRSGQAQAASS